MSNKELVLDFLNSDYYQDKSTYDHYMHKDVTISWNSSEGFSKLNYQEFLEIVLGMGKTFTSLTAEISHAIVQKDKVAVRFTYNVETVEHPESTALGHFFSFWEIKDEKLFKIYLMSHPADETPDNITSYLTV